MERTDWLDEGLNPPLPAVIVFFFARMAGREGNGES